MPITIKNIFLSLLFVLATAIVNGQTYITNGNAVNYGNGLIRLTESYPDGAGIFQASTAWNDTQHDLNESFEIEVDMFFGCRPEGADGISFTFHQHPDGTAAIGGGGGFLAMPQNAPSVSVEFDTWQYTPGGDIAEDHITILQNGNANNTAPNPYLAGPVAVAGNRDLENCADNANDYYTVRIVWTPGSTQTLDVYEEEATSPSISYSGDMITDIFGGNTMVWWGFTSATGGESNEQWIAPKGTIIPWQCEVNSCCVPFEVDVTGLTELCEGDTLDLEVIDDSYTAFSWSNGSTTIGTQITEPGIYTVDVTQLQSGTLCPSTDTIIVEATGATGSLTGDALICPDGTSTTPITLTFDNQGDEPFELIYSIDGVSQPAISGISTSPYQFNSESQAGEYKVESFIDNSGCSAFVPETVTVGVYPGNPNISDTSICSGQSVLLSVVDEGGTYDWYTTQTGGTSFNTGVSYQTPTLNTETTYYIESSSLTDSIREVQSYADLTEGTGNNTWSDFPDNNALSLNRIVFTPNIDFKLDSIDVYTWSPGGTCGEIIIRIADLTAGTTQDVSYTPSSCQTNLNINTVPIKYDFIQGRSYRITSDGQGGHFVMRYLGLVPSFPITDYDNITYTESSGSTSWPGLFRWQISYPNVAASCSRAEVTVSINTTPEINLTDSVSVCSPSTVDLTSLWTDNNSSGGTVSYYNDANLLPANIVSDPSSISTTGDYYVSIDNSSCSDTASVNIAINSLPSASLELGSTYCNEDIDTGGESLTVSVTDGLAPYNVDYTGPNGGGTLIVGSSGVDSLENLSVGTYEITSITDDNGCTNTISGETAVIDTFALLVVDTLATCDFGTGQATLEAQISLGEPSYEVSDETTNPLVSNSLGTISSSTYSRVIDALVLTEYSYVITDASGGGTPNTVCDDNSIEVTGQISCGCPVEGTLSLSSVEPDSWFCAGDSIALDVYAEGSSTGNYSITLTNSAGTIYDNPIYVGGTSPAVYRFYVDEGDTYSISDISDDICVGTSSGTVELTELVSPSIYTDLVSSSSLCPGDSLTLLVGATGTPTLGQIALDYLWYKDSAPITGQTDSSYTIQVVDALSAGTYSVEVTGECGTANSSDYALTINELVEITLDPTDESICETESATFTTSATGTPSTGSSELTYQWHHRDGLGIETEVGTNSDSYTIDPAILSDSGSYWVEVEGLCNIDTSLDAILSILPQDDPSVSLSASHSRICVDDELTFTATGTTISSTKEFTFYDISGNLLSGPADDSIYITAASITTHDEVIVSMSVPASCPADGSILTVTDTVTLTVEQSPNPDITTNDTSICEFTSVTLNALELNTGVENTTYQWYMNNAPVSTATSQIEPLTVSSTGSYKLVADHEICGILISDTIDVDVVINPEIAIVLSDEDIENGEIIFLVDDDLILEADTSYSTSITWSGVSATEEDSVLFESPNEIISNFSVEEPGRYLVYATAFNGPCQRTDSTSIFVAPEVRAPNVFTPNGDGIHETFQIIGIEYKPGAVVTIFNRWGKKVYESDSYYDNEWTADGLPDGVYYFIILSTEDEDYKYAGTVHVLR